MSYSVCINCEQMVSGYEKYCPTCLKRYPGLKQDKDYHRRGYDWETSKATALKETGTA